LESGIHHITEAIILRPEDSGLTIEGDGAIISGGMSINVWNKQGQLYVADIPDFNGRPIDFRQLWVNQEKAIRANNVNENWESMHRILTYDKQEKVLWIPKAAVGKVLKKNSLKSPYLEMVLHQMWCVSNLRIKSLDVQGDSVAVTFHDPESKLQFEHPWPSPMTPNTGHPSPFYLTNSKELMDWPG
jgi:hypothetical protein